MAMKKKETEFLAEVKRHMNILKEDMDWKFKLIAEQHGSIVVKLEEHDSRFDVIDIDLKAIKGTLFGMSHRVTKLESAK